MPVLEHGFHVPTLHVRFTGEWEWKLGGMTISAMLTNHADICELHVRMLHVWGWWYKTPHMSCVILRQQESHKGKQVDT